MLIHLMLIIRILFTNYDIITDFLNLAFCSEHFISIKHRILPTFNIKQNSILIACVPLTFHLLNYIHIYRGNTRGRERMVVGFTTTRPISVYHH